MVTPPTEHGRAPVADDTLAATQRAVIASQPHLTIHLSRQRLTTVLLVGVALLFVIYVLALIARHHLGHANLYGLIDRFHFDGEANVPALYATFLPLSCAVVVALIAAGKHATDAPYAFHWTGLVILLLIVAVDEGAQFHELLTRPMRELIDSSSGWFRYAWVIPGAAIAAVVGLLYLRFLIRLPTSTSRRFMLAGALFVGAAVGFEMIAGWYITHRSNDLGYYVIAGIEEALEMIAVILALDTALRYLARHTPTVTFTLSPGDASGGDAPVDG